MESLVLMKFLSKFILLTALVTQAFTALGHGSMASPISRVYRIFQENPEYPQSAVSRAAIAVAGTQPFYDWSEVNRLVPDRNYRALIPDGQLASAGRAKYAGLDLVRSDWPATRVNRGPFHLVFDASIRRARPFSP
jgi:predicted carbohydrate-binding protein with CBM5 and CBM33 domain